MLVVFPSFLYLKPHWQFQSNRKSLWGDTVKWKFLPRLWLLHGLKHILKGRETLGVSDQTLRWACWTKHPECFLWTVSSPRTDGSVCRHLVTEPSRLFLQARLPVPLKNQHWRSPGTCLQRPRAKQAQICVSPVQKDISRVSTSITNMLGRKHDLGCPSCQHQVSECR